ncbi:hypothetical protein ACFLWB_02455 [Chloroflexota bacterium]
MSQLIEKLKGAARQEGQSLGFKAHLAARSPSMVLVIRLPKEDVPPMTALASVDAVLLEVKGLDSDAALSKAAVRRFGVTPWGVLSKKLNREEASHLKEAGCDFMVFPTMGTPVSALKQEGVGRIMSIPTTLEDSLAAAINELPVDAVLIHGEEEPFLTVQSLMSIQRLTGILKIPALAAIPPESGGEELEALKLAGLSGVVLALKSAQVESKVKELRQAINDLPSEGKKQRARRAALLPSASIEESSPLEEEL